MRPMACLAVAFCIHGSAALAQTPANPAASRPTEPVEKLVTFDYRQARLTWSDSRWQLRAGDVWLKDFGRRESEGREALRLIREYRLTQYGTVGIPKPVMEYWLSEGKAPQTTNAPLHVTTIDSSSLKVEQVQGQWLLREAGRTLFVFGHADEAQQAASLIRKYGFNQIGFVGRPVPLMTYFLAGQQTVGAGSLAGPASLAARTVPNDKSARGDATSVAQDKFKQQDPSSMSRQLPNRNALFPDASTDGIRVTLDWRQIQVRQDGREWKLVQDSYILGDFGTNEREARQALRIVQHYRFTEQYLVGGTNPSFSYFLVNGRPPWGIENGTNPISLRAIALHVEHQEKHYFISDGERMLFDLGEREDDAKQALKILQKYKFDHLCHVGSPGCSGLTFLVRTW